MGGRKPDCLVKQLQVSLGQSCPVFKFLRNHYTRLPTCRLTLSWNDESLIFCGKGKHRIFSNLKALRIIVPSLLILSIAATETACVRRGDDWQVGERLSRDSGPTPGSKRLYHLVTKDETLSGIAMRYQVSGRDIARENQLESPFVIKEGLRLVLPIHAVDPPAQTTDDQVKREIDQESSDSLLCFPISTKITQKFGEGDEAHRNGISFEGYEGAEVKAAASGIVGHVGEIPGLGKVALIEHEDHLVSVYAHLNHTKVSTGEKVTRNQIIGTLGGPGKGANPTLYFEVRSRARAVNPMRFMKTKKQ